MMEFASELSHLRVIASATSGTAVLLNLLSGEVVFYEPDHDYEEFKADITGHFEIIASSFGEFVNGMISEEKAGALMGI